MESSSDDEYWTASESEKEDDDDNPLTEVFVLCYSLDGTAWYLPRYYRACEELVFIHRLSQ